MSTEFVELGQFTIDPASVQLLPRAYSEANKVVILGVVDPKSTDPVDVGMLEPERSPLLQLVAIALGRTIRPVQLSAHEIAKAIERGWAGHGGKAEWSLALEAVERLSFQKDVEVPAALSEILGHAVMMRASDVHIEAHEDDVDVRFRVDGALKQVTHPLGPKDLRRLVTRLKVLAGLDIAESRIAQEGRVLASYGTATVRRQVDFRVSIIPGPFGEDAVLRVIEGTTPITDLPALGFSNTSAALLEDLLASPEGLLLTTGPTGSGKTTTLYGLFSKLAGASIKILTAEDPIEFRLPKVSQKQIGWKLGYAEYAKAFLRQDPDVMMIGEIRDEETAAVAIRAAQTGHLVMSTLHTSDAVGAVRRLETLGVEPENLGECLLGVLAQRLLRRVCAGCSAEVEDLEAELAKLPRRLPIARAFRGRGCPACAATGQRGRVGIFELFVPDDELAEMIVRRDPLYEIRARARRKGMHVLVEEGMRKVEAGLAPVTELRAALSYRALSDYAAVS